MSVVQQGRSSGGRVDDEVVTADDEGEAFESREGVL